MFWSYSETLFLENIQTQTVVWWTFLIVMIDQLTQGIQGVVDTFEVIFTAKDKTVNLSEMFQVHTVL